MGETPEPSQSDDHEEDFPAKTKSDLEIDEETPHEPLNYEDQIAENFERKRKRAAGRTQKGRNKGGSLPEPRALKHESGVLAAPESTEKKAAQKREPTDNLIQERREGLEQLLERLAIEREAYEEAKKELIREVRSLRSKHATESEQASRIDHFVNTFRETEHARILQKVLPDKPGAKQFSDKLRRIAEIAFNLPYWSKGRFNQLYEKQFGNAVIEDFDDEERMILDDLLNETDIRDELQVE